MKNYLLLLAIFCVYNYNTLQSSWIQKFNEANYFKRLIMVHSPIDSSVKAEIIKELKNIENNYKPIFCKTIKNDLTVINILIAVSIVSPFFLIGLGLNRLANAIRNYKLYTALASRIMNRSDLITRTQGNMFFVNHYFNIYNGQLSQYIKEFQNSAITSGISFIMTTFLAYICKRFYNKHKTTIDNANKIDMLEFGLLGGGIFAQIKELNEYLLQ